MPRTFTPQPGEGFVKATEAAARMDDHVPAKFVRRSDVEYTDELAAVVRTICVPPNHPTSMTRFRKASITLLAA